MDEDGGFVLARNSSTCSVSERRDATPDMAIDQVLQLSLNAFGSLAAK